MMKHVRSLVYKSIFLLITTLSCFSEAEGQISLTEASPTNTENFNTMAAGLTLPSSGTGSWRVHQSATPTFAAGSGSVGFQACGTSPTQGGTYNFGVSAACTDRAPGVMTSGSFNSPNSLIAAYQNDGTTPINQLTIAYDAERYRINTATASIEFYYSLNGSTWIAVPAGDIAAASFPVGASAYTFAAPLVVNKTGITISSLSIPVGSVFYLRWNINTTGSNSQGIAIDNVVTTASYAFCSSTATVSSFLPTSGPSNTIITITGTNFTGATGVKVGGVAVSGFTVVNSTTITARLETGTVSGVITVTDAGGCGVQSVGSFTVLSQNANCGSGTGTDLIISEVFDSRTGSVSYVEIFNPTGAPINLSAYRLNIVTDGPTNNFLPALTGTLASGAVGIIRIGDPAIAGSSLCTVTTIQTNDAAAGFNGNDRISLQKFTGSWNDLDVVDNPSYGGGNPPSGSDVRGFSQLRNAGNVTPRLSYVSSEWTNADPETCGHLGTAPASVGTTNVTITSNPSDVSCAAVTFSAAATSSPGPTTFIWYYNAPGSTGWSTVSSLNGTNGLSVTGSGTAIITITGNTAILKDYQVYCEFGSSGSPQCVKYSRAAAYTYASQPYYRTRASGQWTNPAIWEMSTTEGGVYVNACQYPVSANSDKVNILSTHIVTLDIIDVTIDWVNINLGGGLTIGNASLLTFNNGNTGGADLQVNGTLIDGGSSGNGVSFSSATWEMGIGSNLFRTNTSSAAVYRDNYQGGMSTIPTNANWIIRGSSTVDVPFTTVNTFYPNLTIESTSGLWNPLPATTSSRFSGNSNFATVKGSLNIGGSTAGTVTVYNENTNATSMQVLGNLTIRTGCTLTNNGNLEGTGFEVKGNIIINGTFTNNGIGSAGLLTLSGSNAQSISGTGTANIYSVTLNNTSATGITLNRSLSMSGVLTLTDGLLNTSLTNMFTMENGSSVAGMIYAPNRISGASDNSFVSGPMRKIGNTNFIFPVGKPLTLANGNTVGGHHLIGISSPDDDEICEFEAEYYLGNAGLIGSITSPGLVNVSACEYWRLNKNAGPAISAVDVTVSWNANSNCTPSYITVPVQLVVAHNTSTTYTSAGYTTGTGNWDAHGKDPVLPHTGDATAGTVTWPGVNTFSPFALGSLNRDENPLPFNLTRFTATRTEKSIQLNWNVSNNDEQETYILERSRNGVQFQTLTTVAAKTGITADYIHHDLQPQNGWNYYRLRVKDRLGKTQTSAIVKAAWGKAELITVSPNPATEKMVINLSDPSSIQQIQVVNTSGQIVKSITNLRSVNEIAISSWQAGMYYIRFIGQNGITTKTFIKQ